MLIRKKENESPYNVMLMDVISMPYYRSCIKQKRDHNSPENGELMASLSECCIEIHNTCCCSPLACTTINISEDPFRKFDHLENRLNIDRYN